MHRASSDCRVLLEVQPLSMGSVLVAVDEVSARQWVGCALLKGQFQLGLKCKKLAAELLLDFVQLLLAVGFKS